MFINIESCANQKKNTIRKCLAVQSNSHYHPVSSHMETLLFVLTFCILNHGKAAILVFCRIFITKLLSLTQLSWPSQSSSCDVRLCICMFVPSQCNLFRGLSLALRSHDQFPGLSLVKSLGVKNECINTTVFVLMHSI